MAEGGTTDVVIQDAERGPVDNRPTTGSTKTHPGPYPIPDVGKPATKKKRHIKKLAPNKEKSSKEQPGDNASRNAQTTNTSPYGAGSSSQDEIYIPPDVRKAIKRSLRDNLVHICQQTSKTRAAPSTSSPHLSPTRMRRKMIMNHSQARKTMIRIWTMRIISLDFSLQKIINNYLPMFIGT